VEGEPFSNLFFALEVASGTVGVERGMTLSFTIENNFATTALQIGPSPTGADYAVTAQGRRLSISDGGTSTLSIFDAVTLLPIITLF
jgi:hypothetical protein